MYKLTIPKFLRFLLTFLLLIILLIAGWYFGEFLKTLEGSALGTLVTLTTGIWFFWDKIDARPTVGNGAYGRRHLC